MFEMNPLKTSPRTKGRNTSDLTISLSIFDDLPWKLSSRAALGDDKSLINFGNFCKVVQSP